MAEASETTEKAEHDFYHQEMKWESEPALTADQYVCLDLFNLPIENQVINC
jgi:hypothetical protein